MPEHDAPQAGTDDLHRHEPDDEHDDTLDSEKVAETPPPNIGEDAGA